MLCIGSLQCLHPAPGGLYTLTNISFSPPAAAGNKYYFPFLLVWLYSVLIFTVRFESQTLLLLFYRLSRIDITSSHDFNYHLLRSSI